MARTSGRGQRNLDLLHVVNRTGSAMKAEGHLARREANFQPLTPLDFLQRTVSVYPNQVAVIWHDRHWTYREFAALVGRFASVLRDAGLRRGDVVSIMARNRPEMLA